MYCITIVPILKEDNLYRVSINGKSFTNTPKENLKGYLQGLKDTICFFDRTATMQVIGREDILV